MSQLTDIIENFINEIFVYNLNEKGIMCALYNASHTWELMLLTLVFIWMLGGWIEGLGYDYDNYSKSSNLIFRYAIAPIYIILVRILQSLWILGALYILSGIIYYLISFLKMLWMLA